MHALAMAVGLVLAGAACNPYDGDDGSCRRSVDCSDDTVGPDPSDDVHCPGLARCEAGVITVIDEGDYAELCPIEAGAEVGQCERGCIVPEVSCVGDVCAPAALLESMCYVPAPVVACTDVGAACDDEGAARACETVVVCETDYGTGACACSDGAWQCDVPCPDGLCSAAAVQDAIVGSWHGAATAEFGVTWDLSLQILPDHHYVGDAETDDELINGAFYYGADGELELQWIDVVSQSADGAVARVNLGWADSAAPGTIHELLVTADTMTFTFVPPLGCGYEIDYVLTRSAK